VARAECGGYLVTFPTGRVELASSLSEIWHCLAKRDVPVPDVLAVSDAE
jgi:hypothetical protein